MGTTIDRRYEVRRVVAEGGFGVVYEAEAIALGVKVAIKVLRAEAVSSSPEARARFAQEAKLLARLRHPAIVSLTDAAHLEDGTPYLALEWIEGETLDAYLERVGPLPLEDAVSLLGPVASAIAYAHDEGVVHRDLKPGNVMIGRNDRRAKVLDFGVARWTSPHGVQTTTTSGTGLSIGFAAPEQYGKEFGPVDGRADQFALAAVTFAALSGTAPFAGDTLTEVMFATCLSQERPSLSRVPSLPHSLPRAVDAVLQRALSIRPDQRFTTIRAFWSALEEAARHGDTASAPATQQVGPPTRTAGAMPSPATLPSPNVASGPATIATPSIGVAPTQPAPMTGPAGTRPTGQPSSEPESPPSSLAPSTKVSSTTRWLLVFAVLATIGGGAAAAWPLMVPKEPKPKPVPTAKTSTKTSSPSSVVTASAKSDCGKLLEDEVCILGRRFLRGPDDCGVQDPPHRAACPRTDVTINSFAIDRTELSVAKYERCSLAGKCTPIDLDTSKTTPIRKLTWSQAKEVCAYYGKRLPTDDEWELAAGRDVYPWGNENPSLDRASYAEKEGSPGAIVAVDALPKGATRDGLLNLAGNVAEWTSSSAPKADGEKRFWVRGGSAESTAETLRSWAREAYAESTQSSAIGVRCARTPK
ncbi:MAG: bifunctional serine/threonine-protein kinase/formylglycine-generating enzyme family protein [Polyangiales bacterium]